MPTIVEQEEDGDGNEPEREEGRCVVEEYVDEERTEQLQVNQSKDESLIPVVQPSFGEEQPLEEEGELRNHNITSIK